MIKPNLVNSIKILIILVCINACSSNKLPSSLSDIYNLSIFNFIEDESIFDAQTIEAIPYASAIISFGKNSESLIILESILGQENRWISSDRIRFIEKNGRIIRSLGMPNDLYSIERPNLEFDFLIQKEIFEYVAYYSFREPDLNNLKVEISFRVVGPVSIYILGEKKELLLIEESLYSPLINWSAKNKYWVNLDGKFVWKSEQNLSPRLPPIEMQITKKPAN